MDETTYYRASPMWLREGEETTWDAIQDGQLLDAAAHAEVKSAEERVLSFRYRVLKRSLDFGCASILSAILLPAAVVIAACIKLTSKGPVIYREKRIGRYDFQIPDDAHQSPVERVARQGIYTRTTRELAYRPKK
jgi:hypothetical protein